MNMRQWRWVVSVVSVVMASFGCGAPKDEHTIDVRVQRDLKTKLDILFVVDNSPAMAPKQEQLIARFPSLLNVLDSAGLARPMSFHIGVVTSDLGANGFADSLMQCVRGGDSFGGGRLLSRGEGAASSCKAPAGGARYIEYDQRNNTDNLPSGQDLAATFACLARVGDIGCGFEQPLEAAYRALHGDVPENDGFLRPDAALAVVFVTDEDDCSAPDASNIFDPEPNTPPGSGGLGLLSSFRCNSFGHVCDDPSSGMSRLVPYGASGALLKNCRPATTDDGGKLHPVSRYIDFFTKPAQAGGVKDDPSDVVLIALAADPEGGYETVLANPGATDDAGQPEECAGPVSSKCQPTVKHSCVAPSDRRFFGDPAVRIKAVVQAATNHQFTSICDTDYTTALSAMGELVVSNVAEPCVREPLQNPNDPRCTVDERNAEGEVVATIPKCELIPDPPCWRLSVNGGCAALRSPVTCELEQMALEIERGAEPPPENLTVHAACHTVALAPGDEAISKEECRFKNGR